MGGGSRWRVDHCGFYCKLKSPKTLDFRLSLTIIVNSMMSDAFLP